MASLLLVVPQHNGESGFVPGGQVTAADGLIRFLREEGHVVSVVNAVPKDYTRAGIFSKVRSMLKRVANAGKSLRSGKIDHVVAFAGPLAVLPERIAVCLVARAYGVNSALFFRNSDILRVDASGTKGRLLGMAMRIPGVVLVQGRAWEEQLVAMGVPANKVAVIPNWIPPWVCPSTSGKEIGPDETVRFLFVGRIVRSKGVFEIVKAAARLRHEYEFELTLAGDGPDLSLLRETVDMVGLANVLMPGWRGPEELAELLRRAHVFLFPSYHPEGFPNAVLEAMAHGLPVVATDCGATGDSVHEGRNGYLVSPRAPWEVARAMRRYLREPRLIEAHSSASLAVVAERHNRQLNCRRVIAALERASSGVPSTEGY